jgi:hypothetical protein
LTSPVGKSCSPRRDFTARHLLTAAFVLIGLRVEPGAARQVFQGVRAMHDSATYMAILEEGRVEELHETILELGTSRFGPPDAAARASLKGMTALDRLRRLRQRLLTATSWQELLATP